MGILLCIIPSLLYGQESPQTVAKKPSSESDTLSVLPAKMAIDDGIVLPILFTSPETRIGGGVVGVYYYRFSGEGAETRPSNFKGDLIYTQQKQIFIQLIPQFYWENEMNFFDTEFSYIRFTDRFWGIGGNTPNENEEPYANDILRIRLGYYRQLKSAINFGLLYHFENFNIRDRKEGGILDVGDLIVGSSGVRVSGIGFAFNFDSRDNLFSPSGGFFIQSTTHLYLDVFGSEVNFFTTILDARAYYSFIPNHIIATQFYFGGAEGETPFQLLPRLGGNVRMRGYFEGRYRDKLFTTAQVEYRFPLIWRLGGVGFVGLGEIASRFQGFTIENIRYNYGFGLRFAINPDERANLRLDFGFGKNTSGVYLTVNEAF